MVRAVMLHLVGAKLEMLYPDLEILHSCYPVNGSRPSEAGDFVVGDHAVHVGTAPCEALLEKCASNLKHGLRPLVISSIEGIGMAGRLASSHGLQKRIDMLDIDQFLVTDVLGWTGFDGGRRRAALEDLITRFNRIASECENDLSLKIEIY
jgi:hypothetical protein